MGELFSATAYKRLPKEIKQLSQQHQTVCIMLRLRKQEDEIAREAGLQPEEAARLISDVKNRLAATGMMDMVADPYFIPIDGDENGNGAYIALANETVSPEQRLLLNGFLKSLRMAMAALTKRQRQLLRLHCQEQMSVRLVAKTLQKLGKKDSEESIKMEIADSISKLVAQLSDDKNLEVTANIAMIKTVLEETGVEI